MRGVPGSLYAPRKTHYISAGGRLTIHSRFGIKMYINVDERLVLQHSRCSHFKPHT